MTFILFSLVSVCLLFFAPHQPSILQPTSFQLDTPNGLPWMGPSGLFGNGSNGALTITDSRTENTYHFVQSTVFGPGPCSITLGSASGLTVGDEVLVHQTQGPDLDQVGKYEFTYVTAVVGNDVSLADLTGRYSSGSPNVLSPQACVTQLVRVPNYTSLTVGSGGTLECTPWNGTRGGIVVVRVQGTLSIDGTITASFRGFRPGFGDNAGTNGTAAQGESLRGLGLDNDPDHNEPNDGGGGGGYTDPGRDGSGGGGAGHIQAGLPGIALSSLGKGGKGGLPYGGGSAPSRLYFGSGGGGGSIDRGPDANGNGSSGRGGTGGGIVILLARRIESGGTIAARGEDGQNGSSSVAEHGGGGGGSAGCISLLFLDCAGKGMVDLAGGTGGRFGGDTGQDPSGGNASEGELWARSVGPVIPRIGTSILPR